MSLNVAHDEFPRSDLLSNEQHIAIESLLRGSTNTEAAKDAGVDRRTLQRWLLQPEFSSHHRRLASYLHSSNVSQAIAQAPSMLNVLASIASDRLRKDADRTRAAESHLDYGLKAIELSTRDTDQQQSAIPPPMIVDRRKKKDDPPEPPAVTSESQPEAPANG